MEEAATMVGFAMSDGYKQSPEDTYWDVKGVRHNLEAVQEATRPFV